MRRLLYIPVVLALLWVGYWAVGALVLDRAVTGWLSARERDGWVANYSAVEVTGFPFRFETVVRDIELADPRSGVAWTAPEFRFTAHSARPTEITAIWPQEQTLASPFERIEIASERMQGRIAFAPNTGLALRASDIALQDVTLRSTLGWEAALDAGTLVTQRSDRAPDSHDVAFEATGVRLTDAARRRLDPARVLPDEIGVLSLDAWVDFDAPWDRRAIEVARPQVEAIELGDLRAAWGELDLRAAGEVIVDAEGVPTGEVVVKATNWREMLAMAEASGVLPSGLVPPLERAFGLLARLSGPPDTLDAPLLFRNGLVTFGPVPLGPAPRIVLR
jgi:hypothetical protein